LVAEAGLASNFDDTSVARLDPGPAGCRRVRCCLPCRGGLRPGIVAWRYLVEEQPCDRLGKTCHLLEIGAGGEDAVALGDDDRPHLRVTVKGIEEVSDAVLRRQV
jgi:hypothetical protein